MSTRQQASLGVDWHLPDPRGGFRRRRFATTTQASSDLIVLLATDGATWADVAVQVNFDDDAKVVAQGFVNAGYGHIPAIGHLSPHRRDAAASVIKETVPA